MVTVLAACSKDKFTTKPQLKFKSVSSTSLNQGDVLEFKLQVTDKEGDIQDSIWFQRISKVCKGEGANELSDIPSPYAMPKFDSRTDVNGEITMTFSYNSIGTGYPSLGGCGFRADTSVFRFWIRDNGQHVSDTISSPPITFLK